MLREEFDSLCNRKISDEDYKLVEFVYNYHPCNFDKVGIAKLVEEFDMVIIYDMLPRSEAAMEHELLIRRLHQQKKEIEKEIEEALSKAMNIDLYSKNFGREDPEDG